MKRLTEKTMKQINEKLQVEFLKRGFPTNIITRFKKVEDKSGKTCIVLETEKFQTTPVIFKEMYLEIFDATITQMNEILNLWMRIGISYKLFGGGDNGCSLLEFSCEVDGDGDIYNENIK